MKIKTTVALAASLFIAGFANSVSAHDLNFKTLQATNGAGATDVWELECRDNSHHLVAQVRDFSPDDSNLISLVLFKDGKAVTTTDSTGGDAGYSPLVSLNAGNGSYTMMVSHSRAGLQVYFIKYHCESASGSHMPTTVPSLPVQDQ
jgi:hypothetical protein